MKPCGVEHISFHFVLYQIKTEGQLWSSRQSFCVTCIQCHSPCTSLVIKEEAFKKFSASLEPKMHLGMCEGFSLVVYCVKTSFGLPYSKGNGKYIHVYIWSEDNQEKMAEFIICLASHSGSVTWCTGCWYPQI